MENSILQLDGTGFSCHLHDPMGYEADYFRQFNDTTVK